MKRDIYARVRASKRRQRKHLFWGFIKAIGYGIGGVMAWACIWLLMAMAL